MNTFIKSTAALCALTTTLTAASRPDAHAPIGVMGDHTHGAGEGMLSYRFMTMQMNQIFQGSSSVPANMTSTGYMMTPREMTMDMNMLGFMFAPTDELTLTAMTSYKRNSMVMANAAGAEGMTMKSSGMGDTSIGALYQIHKVKNANAHIGLSLSLPTGATDKKVANAPLAPAIGRDLPYPMQLGSGTLDLSPSITYNHYIDNNWSWGTQAKATIHNSTNDEGYSIGDSANLTGWVSRNLNQNLAINTRFNFNTWSGIQGTQTNGLHNLNPVLSSPADPANSGGHKTDLFIGLNYISDQGLRLAAEIGKTIHQDLNGTQLGSDWTFQLGAQYAW